MKKTEKKLEKSIINSLTTVCETAKIEVRGFEWLTHTVDYNNFPKSLMIYCIFDTEDDIRNAIDAGGTTLIIQLIKKEFSLLSINTSNIASNVLFKTEDGFKRTQANSRRTLH